MSTLDIKIIVGSTRANRFSEKRQGERIMLFGLQSASSGSQEMQVQQIAEASDN